MSNPDSLQNTDHEAPLTVIPHGPSSDPSQGVRVPESISRPSFVTIPGFTDGFSEAALTAAWAKVLEQIRSNTGNPHVLLEPAFIPYCIPLFEPVTPDDAHQKLPLFSQKISDPENPQELWNLLPVLSEDLGKYADVVFFLRKHFLVARHKNLEFVSWYSKMTDGWKKELKDFDALQRFLDISGLGFDFGQYWDVHTNPVLQPSFKTLSGMRGKITPSAGKRIMILQLNKMENREWNIAAEKNPLPLVTTPVITLITQMLNMKRTGQDPEKIKSMIADFTAPSSSYPPHILQALLRDIARICKRRKDIPQIAALPEVGDEDFEDPLKIGKKRLEWLVKDEIPPFNDDYRRNRSSVYTQALLATSNVQLVRTAIKSGSLTRKVKDRMLITFDSIKRDLSKLPAAQMFASFFEIYRILDGMKKKQFFNDFMRSFFDSDTDGSCFSVLQSAYFNDDNFKKDLQDLLRKKANHKDRLINILKTGHDADACAISAKILADLGDNKPKDSLQVFSSETEEFGDKELPETAKSIFSSPEDLYDSVLVENFMLLFQFSQFNVWKRKLISAGDNRETLDSIRFRSLQQLVDLVTCIIKRRPFIEKLFKGKQLIPLDLLVTELKAIPFFAEMHDAVLRTVITRIIKSENPGEEMCNDILNTRTPENFDRQQILEKIGESMPWTDCPITQIDLKGILPDVYEVYITADDLTADSQGKEGSLPMEKIKVVILKKPVLDDVIRLEHIEFAMDGNDPIDEVNSAPGAADGKMTMEEEPTGIFKGGSIIADPAKKPSCGESQSFHPAGQKNPSYWWKKELRFTPDVLEKIKDIWAIAVAKKLGIDLSRAETVVQIELPAQASVAADSPSAVQSSEQSENQPLSPSSDAFPSEPPISDPLTDSNEPPDRIDPAKEDAVFLTVDLREKDPKTRSKSREVSEAITEDKNLIIRLLNGEITDAELPRIRLFRKIKGIKSDQSIFERISTVELKALIENGELINPEVYVMCRSPHIRALGYHLYEHSRIDKDGDSIRYDTLKEGDRQKNAELAYAYYKDSGLPDLDDFRVHPGVIRIPTPVYSKRTNVDIYIEGEDKLIHSRGNLEIKDPHERLMEKLRDEGEMDKWLDRQKEILLQEIEEINISGLPPEEKEREIAARNEKIESFVELKVKTLQVLNLLPADVEKGTREAVQLGLGWIASGTTFNKGHFKSIEEFIAKHASRIHFTRELLIPAGQNEEAKEKMPAERKIMEIFSVEQLRYTVNMINLLARENGSASKIIDPSQIDEELRQDIIDKLEKTPKATAEHQATLMDLYKLMRPLTGRSFIGIRSFDLLTVNGEKGFLWEVKSINTGKLNELVQIRGADGQLDEYEVYDVQTHPLLKDMVKDLTKGIILSKRPQALDNRHESEVFQRYVTSLERKGIFLYWFEGGKIQGSPSALEKLTEYAVEPA